MNLQEQIVSAINTTLKNPIYQTLQLLNIKSILKSANFVKKREGVAPYLVVLHFVYMLVMNKKIATFMHESNRNEDFMTIIATLRSTTQELLGFRCES